MPNRRKRNRLRAMQCEPLEERRFLAATPLANSDDIQTPPDELATELVASEETEKEDADEDAVPGVVTERSEATVGGTGESATSTAVTEDPSTEGDESADADSDRDSDDDESEADASAEDDSEVAEDADSDNADSDKAGDDNADDDDGGRLTATQSAEPGQADTLPVSVNETARDAGTTTVGTSNDSQPEEASDASANGANGSSTLSRVISRSSNSIPDNELEQGSAAEADAAESSLPNPSEEELPAFSTARSLASGQREQELASVDSAKSLPKGEQISGLTNQQQASRERLDLIAAQQQENVDRTGTIEDEDQRTGFDLRNEVGQFATSFAESSQASAEKALVKAQSKAERSEDKPNKGTQKSIDKASLKTTVANAAVGLADFIVGSTAKDLNGNDVVLEAKPQDVGSAQDLSFENGAKATDLNAITSYDKVENSNSPKLTAFERARSINDSTAPVGKDVTTDVNQDSGPATENVEDDTDNGQIEQSLSRDVTISDIDRGSSSSTELVASSNTDDPASQGVSLQLQDSQDMNSALSAPALAGSPDTNSLDTASPGLDGSGLVAMDSSSNSTTEADVELKSNGAGGPNERGQQRYVSLPAAGTNEGDSGRDSPATEVAADVKSAGSEAEPESLILDAGADTTTDLARETSISGRNVADLVSDGIDSDRQLSEPATPPGVGEEQLVVGRAVSTGSVVAEEAKGDASFSVSRNAAQGGSEDSDANDLIPNPVDEAELGREVLVSTASENVNTTSAAGPSEISNERAVGTEPSGQADLAVTSNPNNPAPVIGAERGNLDSAEQASVAATRPKSVSADAVASPELGPRDASAVEVDEVDIDSQLKTEDSREEPQPASQRLARSDSVEENEPPRDVRAETQDSQLSASQRSDSLDQDDADDSRLTVIEESKSPKLEGASGTVEFREDENKVARENDTGRKEALSPNEVESELAIEPPARLFATAESEATGDVVADLESLVSETRGEELRSAKSRKAAERPLESIEIESDVVTDLEDGPLELISKAAGKLQLGGQSEAIEQATELASGDRTQDGEIDQSQSPKPGQAEVELNAKSTRSAMNELQLAASVLMAPVDEASDEEDVAGRSEEHSNSRPSRLPVGVNPFAGPPTIQVGNQAEWALTNPEAELQQNSPNEVQAQSALGVNTQRSATRDRNRSDATDDRESRNNDDASSSVFESIAMRRLRVLQSKSLLQTERDLTTVRSSRQPIEDMSRNASGVELPSLEATGSETEAESGFFELPSLEELLEEQAAEQINTEVESEVASQLVASFLTVAMPVGMGQRKVRFRSEATRRILWRRG